MWKKPTTYEQEQAQGEALENMKRQRELVLEQRRTDEKRRNGVEAKEGRWEDGCITSPDAQVMPVVVTGLRLPFRDVLSLSVQFSIAAIPAAFIAVVVWGIVGKAIFGR